MSGLRERRVQRYRQARGKFTDLGAREINQTQADEQYSDSMLYNQLLYYLSLFDTDKAISTARGTARFDEVRALAMANSRGFAEVTGKVEKYLERNGRRYVDMGGLFGFMERIRI